MIRRRSAERGSRQGAVALARMLALALGLAGCNVEHYQILPDWTPDDAADASEETSADVSDDEGASDVPGESEDQDVQEEEDDGGPPACLGPSEDGDLPCAPGLVCCESGETDYCFDLTSDPLNCGDCGNGCDPGQECVGGTCTEG
jgi:hypothetical protein